MLKYRFQFSKFGLTGAKAANESQGFIITDYSMVGKQTVYISADK